MAAFRGSRIEAQLPSGHVMVCPLDFPAQAGGFLDGMIRAQIDRLTPWTAHDAVFGWSPPVTGANERIEVTFAATSKSKVEPLLQFVQSLAAGSVAIYNSASTGASPAARIKLFDKSLQSAIGSTISLPRLLRGILLADRRRRRGLAVGCGLSREFDAVGAERVAAADFATPRRAAP